MDPIEKRELKRKAWMRLAAQRRRAGMLRGRVVVLSLICFVALWGVVFTQMITGNDPVLGGKERAVAIRAPERPTQKPEVTHRHAIELEPRHETDSEGESEDSAEGGGLEEARQAERAEIEAAEAEPLVTGQS